MTGIQIFSGEYNLLIANAQLIDDDEFQCQIGPATDFRGLTSRTAKVTVLCKYLMPCVSLSMYMSCDLQFVTVVLSSSEVRSSVGNYVITICNGDCWIGNFQSNEQHFFKH